LSSDENHLNDGRLTMDQNRWHRASNRLAVSMMTVGLIGLAACGGGEEAEAPAEEPAAAAPAAPAMPEATVVESMQLQTGAAGLAGQTVRVNGLQVQSPLGTKAFWVALPNKNPFLIVTAEDATVSNGQTVDVVGTVRQMNPTTLNEWVTSGRITENQKLEAEFATEYIEAQAVQPSGGE
jgi:hypothetical protein